MIRILPLLPLLLLGSLAPALAQPPSGQGGGPPPALVVTAEVTEESVRPRLTLVGTVEPQRIAEVAAETEGRVEGLEARRGDRVEQGAPLVRLRTTRQRLALDELQARLAETASRIAKAEDDLERYESLYAEKFVSKEELQAVATEREALQRRAEQTRALIRLQEDRLERMVIRAPFPGEVVAELTEAGQWLGEGDPAVTLADLSRVDILVSVPEQQVAELEQGDTADIELPALPGRTFQGRITAIVAQGDPASRTFPVQVTAENPERRILGGMLAQVSFRVGEPASRLLVPKDAVVPQPGGEGRLAVVRDGAATLVPVRLLGSYGDRFAVESVGPPLAAGDRVIVRGNERVRPGQPVTEKTGPGS